VAGVTGVAAWVGIVVTDLERSVAWYCDLLSCEAAEHDGRWAKLDLPNGTCIELFAGDRQSVGEVFPSYGSDPGPPVLPGYAVEDPEELAERHALAIVRSLPGWVVVTAPDGLRIVLTTAELGPGRGIVGFHLMSADVVTQRSFLRLIDPRADIDEAEAAQVVPILRAGRDGEAQDPDGTPLLLRA
jgi:catechol 2,3-dioxygenase-like lactoylglutathione lyase family enzyme